MMSDEVLPLRLYFGDKVFSFGRDELFMKAKAEDGGDLCVLQVQANPMTAPDPMQLFGPLLGGEGGMDGIPMVIPMDGPDGADAIPIGGSADDDYDAEEGSVPETPGGMQGMMGDGMPKSPFP